MKVLGKILGWLFAIFWICFIAYWIGSAVYEGQITKNEKNNKVASVSNRVLEMIEKYKPDMKWYEFYDSKRYGDPYSIDIKEKIVTSKPILFICDLQDIENVEGKYKLVFNDFELWFYLKGDDYMILGMSNITKEELSSLTRGFAVIAKIDDIKRVNKSEGMSNVCAYGKILDYVYLGDLSDEVKTIIFKNNKTNDK